MGLFLLICIVEELLLRVALSVVSGSFQHETGAVEELFVVVYMTLAQFGISVVDQMPGIISYLFYIRGSFVHGMFVETIIARLVYKVYDSLAYAL